MKSFLLLICSFVLFIGCGQSSQKKGNPIREELVSLTPCELQDKLNMLPAEDLCEYWRYKMDNTLNSKNLTKEEKDVIRPLASLLTKEHYEDDAPANDTSLIDQITIELKEKFGWNDEKLYKYLGTVLTEEELEENIRRGKNSCSTSE